MALVNTSSRAITSRLWFLLNQTQDLGWVSSLAGPIVPSNQAVESFVGLGAIPPMKEWKGPLAVSDLVDYLQRVPNIPWSSSFRVSWQERRFDQTGQVERKQAELITRYQQWWGGLLTKMIAGGSAATALGFDGQPFFSAAHAVGQSGTMSNMIDVGALGAATTVTEAEATAAFFGAVEQLMSFKDDQGEPAHVMPDSFTVMIPPFMLQGFTAALKGSLITGGMSSTAMATGYTTQLVVNPTLTGNVFYVFVNDGRSFIRIQADLQVTAEAEGSTKEHETGDHEYSIRALGNAAYGSFQSGIQATFQ